MRHLLLLVLTCITVSTSVAQQGTNLRQLQRSSIHGQTVATIDTVIFGTDTTFALQFVDAEEGGIDSITLDQVDGNKVNVNYWQSGNRTTLLVDGNSATIQALNDTTVQITPNIAMQSIDGTINIGSFGGTYFTLDVNRDSITSISDHPVGWYFTNDSLCLAHATDTVCYIVDGATLVPGIPDGKDAAPDSLKISIPLTSDDQQLSINLDSLFLEDGGFVLLPKGMTQGQIDSLSAAYQDTSNTNELDSKWTASGTDIYLNGLYEAVGINTTDPFYPLEVYGNPSFSAGSLVAVIKSGADGLEVKDGTSSNPQSVIVSGSLKIQNGSQGGGAIMNDLNDAGAVGQVLTSGGASSRFTWETPTYFSGDYGDLTNTPNIANYWTNQGSNDDASPIYRSGGMGINTTSVASQFDIVSNTAGASMRIYANEAASRSGKIRFEDLDDGNYYEVGIIHALDEYFQIRSNNLASIVIDNNGHIGIGGFPDPDFDLFFNDDFGAQIGTRFYFGNLTSQTNIYAPTQGSFAIENGLQDLLRVDRRGSGSGYGSVLKVEQWSTTTGADGFPAYGFFEESGMGMYRHNANEVGLTTDGVGRLICSDEGVRIPLLDTDLTAPTTTGATKMVVTDNTGQLSFADTPAADPTDELITGVASGTFGTGRTIVITEAGVSRTGLIPAMTGATASAAGSQGVVPPPLAGEDDEFLRGDGTWQPAGNEGGILHDGADSDFSTSSTWEYLDLDDFVTYAYNSANPPMTVSLVGNHSWTVVADGFYEFHMNTGPVNGTGGYDYQLEVNGTIRTEYTRSFYHDNSEDYQAEYIIKLPLDEDDVVRVQRRVSTTNSPQFSGEYYTWTKLD